MERDQSFFSVFSKVFFSPHCGHFWGLHRASFSNPQLLHLNDAISSSFRQQSRPKIGGTIQYDNRAHDTGNPLSGEEEKRAGKEPEDFSSYFRDLQGWSRAWEICGQPGDASFSPTGCQWRLMGVLPGSPMKGRMISHGSVSRSGSRNWERPMAILSWPLSGWPL